MATSTAMGKEWEPLNDREKDPLTPNSECYVVTHKATEEFLEKIQRQREEGYGFVPLIGAGFSAPSGAPLIYDIESYLQRCIDMAVGDKDNKANYNAWRPSTDKWPPFIDREYNKENHQHGFLQRKIHARLMMTLEEKQHLDKRGTLIGQALMEAYGSSADWRSSLLFLSRLEHGEQKDRQSMKLGPPKQEIIDSCLRHVIQRKTPGLNHKMLGVLAGALRLNLLLTTNFDDLIERAFSQTRNALEVLEVILDEPLPHWSAVSGVRSLIKLHGGRRLLRADYSLDAKPLEEDKQRFLSYLVAGKGDSSLEARSSNDGLEFQNHLLVMGVSANESRTLELIRYACSKLQKTFCVFWVCYADSDVTRIKAFARECHGPSGSSCPIVLLKHTEYGLLLLHLYQIIRKNLPPFGGLFPSVSRLTLPPLPAQVPVPIDTNEDFGRKLTKKLEGLQNQNRSTKLIVVTAKPEVRGVTSACSRVFYHLEPKNVCLWLDMNDISSTDDLFEVLLEAAYFRLGQENWVPTRHETDPARRPTEIERLMLSVDRPWIIFLNARETPGANTEEGLDDSRPNGWIDIQKGSSSSDPPDRCTEDFMDLIKQLCGDQSPRISVVLICRDPSSTPVLLSHLKPYMLSMEESTHPFSEEEVVSKAIRWTNGGKQTEQKRRFLHVLVLMQRPRFLATIWSDLMTLGDSDPVADFQVWLNDLEGCGLIRRKAGGFIWMHSRSRARLRTVLRDNGGPFIDREGQAILREWNPVREAPNLHSLLATWYEQVLDASKAPAAVFEAIYHQCRAAEAYLEQTREAGRNPDEAACRLDAAIALLKTNSFLIQTHGYARGSCRRLDHIRRALCGSILEKRREEEERLATVVRQLQISCTEAMRAIAREVGEDKKAYFRHQQYGYLQSRWKLDALIQGDHVSGKKMISEGILKALRDDKGNNGEANTISEWVRWWRWSGMLATATRSYRVAKRAFDKALRCLTSGLEYPAGTGSPVEKMETLRSALLHLPSQQQRVEALRVVEQYVELQLLEYSLEQRARELRRDQAIDPIAIEIKSQEDLKKIDGLIAIGLNLVSIISGADHSGDSHNTIAANGSKCRLLISRSICTSRMELSLRKTDPEDDTSPRRTAMGLLADAEASLRISDPRRYRSELGMVELHRAEARLRRAEGLRVGTLRGRTLLFVEMCRDLSERGRDFNRQQLDREITVKPGELRRVKSLVEDGIHFLDRAEPILHERRRNVWWTTWFFERYLRLIGMSVWASVFEIGTPIPFLGLEAAATATLSIADDLMDNALRMISADVFRLATIVDAYASCAKALRVRLRLDDGHVSIPSREEMMHKLLTRGLTALDVSEELRGESVPQGDEHSAVDKRIQDYVMQVRNESKKIQRELDPEARYPR